MMNAGNKDAFLDVKDLKVHFKVRQGGGLFGVTKYVKAVDGVSFFLKAGETLGVVGESGCGKSSLARAILGLAEAQAGEVVWTGQNLLGLSAREWQLIRPDIQMIFQDPLASLDPRMPIGKIIAEPLKTHRPHLSRKEVNQEVEKMMERVGLLPNLINRYPHEFSGGQCQRIGIARALILRPKLLICDEPVSALDVSIQAQVVNLLKEIQHEMGLAILFIAHDLAIVRHISDRLMVMYLGNVVEMGDCEEIYSSPTHPYTRALMTAVPIPDPRKERHKEIELLPGDLPSPIDLPSGCVFRTRCPLADDHCAEVKPELVGHHQHQVACLKTKAPASVSTLSTIARGHVSH
ncbi:murein tripeptide/oligopeptide ABC transporter ATP binding protein OppF [Bartonella sp. DGB2]|uniref:murein tripeptide/oligopeptide ABC transporter ATP binding protein OppF n=1 Tax=Bartonella sp. DGB2 TaxID=3388426 RepID=UPI00398FDEE5